MRTTIWTVRVKPGKLAETLEAGKAHIAASRREPGCLAFDFYANVDGSDRFVSIEQFRDQEALDLHRQTPHFKAFAKVMDANFEACTMDWLTPPDEASPIP
jgi:quinol monooxygenase YgiN